jgi:microcystin-dependent protein
MEPILSKKLVFLLLPLFLSAGPAISQIGVGTTTPDNNAELTISSSSKGLLIPRLNDAQLATLAASLGVAETGMMVTSTTTGRPVYWTGAAWSDILVSVNARPPLRMVGTNHIAINAGTQAGDLLTWDGNNWINMQPAIQHFSIPMDNRQPFLAVNYCIAVVGDFPSRNDAFPFLSQIQIFPYNFAPVGWFFCDGQLLSISQYAALFTLIGASYGGDGKLTFALPDLQGRIVIGAGQAPGLTGYQVGNAGGVESGTITR